MRIRSSPGSKWMSDAPRSTASVITRCTSWIADSSWPSEPNTISALSDSYAGSGPLVGSAGGSASAPGPRPRPPSANPRAPQGGGQPLGGGGGGDARPHLVAGHDGDVVD